MAETKRRTGARSRNKMRQAMQGVIKQAADNIAKFGWHITGVFPTEAQADQGYYAYTTGANLRELPELIITGISLQLGAEMLNVLLNSLRAGTETVHEDSPYTELFNLPIYLRKLTPEQVTGFMTMTESYYRGNPFDAYQFVYPDPQGRFPWDEGYDFPPQTLLFNR